MSLLFPLKHGNFSLFASQEGLCPLELISSILIAITRHGNGAASQIFVVGICPHMKSDVVLNKEG
jgi:hypothetical protein